jgi:acetate kinase
MKILVVNCGSSSLKYKLFDMEKEEPTAEGAIQRIGIDDTALEHEVAGGAKLKKNVIAPDHDAAMKVVIDVLTDPDKGILKDVSEISAVGHRIVHGGERLTKPTLVNDATMRELEHCIDLAPLHTRAHIMGINACLKVMGDIPQVIVVDTAFHMTLPGYAFMYGIPYEYYEKYSVRKYGFHGTSHMYVSRRAAAILNQPLETLKTITCHLGNGASVDAVTGGKAIDTSMGFTPLAGLLMGTRSGDIDPAVVTYIMEKENISPEHANHEFLNKESGLLGVSGLSSDMRDIVRAMNEGHERAKLAFDMFCYRVQKYIGAFMVAMEGLDALVFTAGIGENQGEVREAICKRLEFLGVKLDLEKNKRPKQEMIISTPDSKINVLVIPTNEELVIARETVTLVSKKAAC